MNEFVYALISYKTKVMQAFEVVYKITENSSFKLFRYAAMPRGSQSDMNE